MGEYVHASFNAIGRKNEQQVFAIDDVITALEQVVADDVKLMRDFAKSVNMASKNASYISNTAFVPKDTSEIAMTANALIAARSMKDNGMETILLDPRFKMWTQVLKQVNEETCPDLFHKGADSFTILKFTKLS